MIPIVGKNAVVEPPREPVPVKNGFPKVTVLAEVPEAIDVLTVSVLRFTLASNPSSVTLIFWAGSFDSNSH